MFSWAFWAEDPKRRSLREWRSDGNPGNPASSKRHPWLLLCDVMEHTCEHVGPKFLSLKVPWDGPAILKQKPNNKML